MSVSRWVATSVLLLAVNLPPPPAPTFELHGLTWSWAAPRAQWSTTEQAWLSNGAALHVDSRQSRSLHWEVRAPAGVVAPLRFRVEGASHGFVRNDGVLVLSANGLTLTESHLVAFQPKPDGTRRPLVARYEGLQQRRGGFEYSLALDDVDANLPVVVDPDVSVSRVKTTGGQFVPAVAAGDQGETWLVSIEDTGSYVHRFDDNVLVASWAAPSTISLRDLVATDRSLFVLGSTSNPQGTIWGTGGGSDAVLLRFDLDCRLEQELSFGTSGGDTPMALAAHRFDLNGPISPDLIAVVGSTNGTDVFSPATGNAPDGNEGFVAIGPVDLTTWPAAAIGQFLGGRGTDLLRDVSWGANEVWVLGQTDSEDLEVLNALQAAPRGGKELFFAAFDARGGLDSLSYYGGDDDDHPWAIQATPQDTVVIAGSTTGRAPLSVPFSPNGEGYLAFLSKKGAKVQAATRVPNTETASLAMAQRELLAFATIIEGDFPLRAQLQDKLHGETDFGLAMWDVERGLPVWSTPLGGAQGERRTVTTDVSSKSLRWLVAGTTVSSDFTGSSSLLNDDEVALIDLVEGFDGGISGGGTKTFGTGTLGECSPPIQVLGPTDWALAGRGIVTRVTGGLTYADPECRVPTSGIVTTKARNEGLVFVKGGSGNLDFISMTALGHELPVDGPFRLDASPRGLKMALPQADTVLVGTCVDLKQNYGSIVTSLDESGQYQTQPYSDDRCGGTNNGASSLLGTKASIHLLQSAGEGVSTSTGLVVFADPGSASGLVLVGPQRLVANQCSGAHYLVTTDGVKPVSDTGGFTLTTTLDNLELFSDEQCSRPLADVTLSTAAGVLYLLPRTTGRATMDLQGRLTGTWAFDVVPGPPTRLTFSRATTVAVGGCARLDIESRDDPGNETAEERPLIPIDLAVTLGPGNLTFYTDSKCSRSITARDWSEGLWWVPVWIRGEASGSATVSATSDRLNGTTVITVTGGGPGPANALRVGTAPTQLQRGECSSVTNVQALDTATPVTLNEDLLLTSTDGTLQFFSDASCTQAITRLTGPIGTAGSNFYLRTSSLGARTVTITSSISGLQTSIAPGSIPGPPRSFTAPSSANVTRDACIGLSVDLRDAVASTSGTVNVVASGAGLTLGTSGCGTSSSLTLSFNGAPLTLFVSGATIGTGTLTFTPQSVPGATTSVVVNAPPVARWRFKLQPDGGPAAYSAIAGACTPVDFEALDLSGRTTPSPAAAPLDGGAPSVFFHSVGDCDGGLVTASAPNVPESGARLWVRSTVAQSSQLAVGLAAQTGVAPFTVTAAAPALLSAPATLTLQGRTCATLGPVTLRDAFGNAVSSWPGGVTVTGTNTARSSLATDCSALQSPTTLSSFPITLGVSALTAGTASLRFDAVDGGAPSVTTTLTVGWPAAVGYVLRDAGAELIAGDCGSGRLFALDDGGVPTRASTSLPLSADTTSAQTFTNASCTAPASATLAAVDEFGAPIGFRETRAGRTTFQFGPVTWPVDVDAGTPSRLAMNAVVVTAKTCPSPFELRVEDAWGNRARTSAVVDVSTSGSTGATVASGATCGTASSAMLLLNDTASAQLAVTALRAGDAGLRFTSLSFPTLDVPVTVLEGLNDAPVVTVPTLEVVVDEGDAGRADLSVFDLDWDPVSLQLRQLAGPTFGLTTLGPVQVDGDATASFVLVAPANGTITEDLLLEYSVLVADGPGAHLVDAGVRFRVRDTVNELPVAVLEVFDAGPAPHRLNSGQPFSLSAARSSDPNRFDTLVFAWSVDGGLALDAGPGPASLALVAPAVGPGGERLHVTLEARDSRGGTSTASVDLDVSASDTPVITSTPRTLAQRDLPWSYDLDGLPSASVRLGVDTLRWSLAEAPTGATIDSLNGRITWTPTDSGGDFVLRATTTWGWTEQRFTVTVLELPRITSTPATTARLLQPWLYDADGRVEGDNVTWWELDAQQHPTGMVIEGTTGRITWTPLVSGDAEVVVIASNALGRVAQTFTVRVGDATTVLIADTANRQAQRGVGYVYDADRAVDVTPAGTPVRLISIVDHDEPTRLDDLDRFSVSPGGQVAWIPTRTGTFDVTVGAGNGTVATTYSFSIRVSEPSNEAPTAVGTATPDNGPSAPFSTHLDGRASTAAPGRTLVLWSWEAGDGTPPRFGAEVDATYAEARGYSPRLEVADDLGNRASATLHVGVGVDGVLPPEASIVVTANEMLDRGKSRVSLACECRDPGGRPLTLTWNFGDGNATSELAPSHTYTHAATYWVTLVVSNGPLTTQVRQQVEVRDGEKRPPSVQAWAQPVFGKAPLSVKFTSAASDYDGIITTRQWDFGGGITAMADDTSRRFENPGRYTITFRGTDDDGLTSEDSVEVVVTGDDGLAPPLFTSRATSRVGVVGTPWQYDEDGRLAARGATRYGAGRERNGVLQGVPEGLTVDPATGLVTWTPKSPGAWPLIFWAENAAGRVFQTDVVVDVPAPPSGCGCAQVDTGAVVLLALLALRRRRREAA